MGKTDLGKYYEKLNWARYYETGDQLFYWFVPARKFEPSFPGCEQVAQPTNFNERRSVQKQ